MNKFITPIKKIENDQTQTITLSRLFQESNPTVDYNLTISQSYRPVHPEKLKQESNQQFK